MNFTKHTLQNGLRVVLVPMLDNPTVTVLAMVEAGSKYEEKRVNGVSHFLEHMCFKGTTKRPKAINISHELDSIGAQYNAFTSQEYTGYYVKADIRHKDTALDVVADMYLNSVFDAHEIEKEKGVIVEEINMYQDMPQRHIQDVFLDTLYGDQPAGWNIAGTEAFVRGLTRDDIVTYRAQHYVATATTIVVAGTFNEQDMLAQVTSAFAAILTGSKSTKLPTTQHQTEPVITVVYKETDQTHLVVGVRSFDVTDARTPILRILSVILGGGMSSRLFTKLRDEMGVGYYVHAGNDTYTDHGVFAVSTGVDSRRVHEVITAILTEFTKIRDIPILPAELQKAKDYLIGNMNLSLESSDEKAEFVGFQEVLKHTIKTPDEIIAEITSVTAEQVQSVARDIFTDAGLNLALIGKFSDTDAFKKIVTLL